MNTQPDKQPGISGPGKWIAAFLVVVLILAGAGAGFFVSESSRIRQKKSDELAAIAVLKSRWIADWRQRVLGGVGKMAGYPFFSHAVAELAETPLDAFLLVALAERLKYELGWTGHEAMALYSLDDALLIAAGAYEECPEAIQVVKDALATPGAVLSPLYKSRSGDVHITAACPVNGPDGDPVAVLAVTMNAKKELFPLVEEWPARSRTAETLLVMRDRNDALVLNNLHNKANSALNYRIPLTEVHVPSVQAVMGKTGGFFGRDYRGGEVISDLRRVAGSPWFMVAKVNLAEANADLYETMDFVIIVFVCLSIAVAAAMAALYSGGQVRLLRKLDEVRAESEENLRQLNAHLEERVARRTAQLEASNSELEAFAYSVSHDLRAPLRSIEGFAAILEEEYGQKLDDEARRLLGVVRSGTRKMDHLIHDILDLSRVSRTELVISDVDMTGLVRSVWEEIQTPEEAARFDFRLGPLPGARGDVLLLRQLWTNLISNAVKYTSRSEIRRIEIGAGEEEDSLCYFVKDSGVGFDPAYSAKLFGLFQRLHTDVEFEGTGVGLATVQRIVHRHGGSVRAESGPGAGATFSFILPKNPSSS